MADAEDTLPPDLWWARRFATTFTHVLHRMVAAQGLVMRGRWAEALSVLQQVNASLGKLILAFEQFINRQKEEQ